MNMDSVSIRFKNWCIDTLSCYLPAYDDEGFCPPESVSLLGVRLVSGESGIVHFNYWNGWFCCEFFDGDGGLYSYGVTYVTSFGRLVALAEDFLACFRLERKTRPEQLTLF